MKRWLVGSLLVALAGVLLVIVINSNRDPIAVLEEFGAKREKESAVRTIERNEKGEVVEVNLDSASISPPHRRLLYEMFRVGSPKRLLSDAELVHLKGLTKLETLDLSDNQITDLTPLVRLTNLKVLGLVNTSTPDDQKEMLSKTLPNCRVIDRYQPPPAGSESIAPDPND